MNVVEMSPDQFAHVVDRLMEGKLKDPFQEWESESSLDVRKFEYFCASCLDDPRSNLHGRAIA